MWRKNGCRIQILQLEFRWIWQVWVDAGVISSFGDVETLTICQNQNHLFSKPFINPHFLKYVGMSHMFVLNSDGVGTFQALLSTLGSIFPNDKVLCWVLTAVPFVRSLSMIWKDKKGSPTGFLKNLNNISYFSSSYRFCLEDYFRLWLDDLQVGAQRILQNGGAPKGGQWCSFQGSPSFGGGFLVRMGCSFYGHQGGSHKNECVFFLLGACPNPGNRRKKL